MFAFPSKLRFENKKTKIRNSSELDFFLVFLFIRDPGGIQTPNPQSRNLMRYSIAPRGQIYLVFKPSFSLQEPLSFFHRLFLLIFEIQYPLPYPYLSFLQHQPNQSLQAPLLQFPHQSVALVKIVQ